MQKLKRLLALGAAAMMLVGSASLPVSASPVPNYKNTKWSINVEPARLSTTTALRQKVDASSTYVYYEGGTKDYFTCDVLNSAGKSQCNKTGTIHKGEEGVMMQFVYENGYRECKLKITSQEGSYGGGVGMWSPDSIGTYHCINK